MLDLAVNRFPLVTSDVALAGGDIFLQLDLGALFTVRRSLTLPFAIVLVLVVRDRNAAQLDPIHIAALLICRPFSFRARRPGLTVPRIETLG